MEDELRMIGCEKLAQRCGKGLRLFRLRARCSVGVQRVADEDDFYLVLSDEASDGFEICARGSAMQRKKRLRGDPERIGDGDADAAVANVERECAGMGHR